MDGVLNYQMVADIFQRVVISEYVYYQIPTDDEEVGCLSMIMIIVVFDKDE